MKKFLSIISVLIISTLCFAGCNIVKDKAEEPATDAKYFEFVEIEGGYAISAKEGETLPEDIKLPSTYNDKEVIEIAKEGFKNTSVKTVKIPEGYKTVGIEAFAYCTSLTKVEIATYQGGVAKELTVSSGAFKGCTSLYDVKFGQSVRVIDGYAFSETKIGSVTTLTKAVKVGTKAFANCKSLTRFVVAGSLTDIDETAFDGSNNVRFEVADSNTVYKSENNELVKKEQA